ncbi:hypothetical protein AU468_13515 [Alkalispirochaeta sphaeroplastigenens]|uniref:Uncharacterized protein n=1 Tax=Alkalispirochaeta sphaeroplastigenens TaxID=1187066 RepID=A0A2S4JFM6_9SPIO|nr:hypothetical protein [Alkalispirochaeta sphaeroplastigenens]POQ98368.1 hypothetical protein AU468_13515 [Alkalispirochaeta sphaeroplastigenens]
MAKAFLTDNEKFAEFGKQVFKLLDERGWNSIPRREMTIHLIDLAVNAELVNDKEPLVKLARQLMIPPGTLDRLLRDRLLFTRKASAFDDQEFSQWARSNSQTTVDDNKKSQVTFAVASLAEAMQVEAYFDELGLVPDYKNNRRLLVLDLSRLVRALAQISRTAPVELIDTQQWDARERQEALEAAQGSSQTLLSMALQAVREQADQHIGTATVEFALTLIQTARRRMRVTQSTQIEVG